MPTKPWFLSRTIVSGIVGFVISILTIFHVNLHSWQGQIVDVTTQVAEAVFSTAALFGVIYGRFGATKPITLLPKPKVTDVTSPGRGLQIVFLILSGCIVSGLVGCAGGKLTPGAQSFLTGAQSYAWTVANSLQTTDGQALTNAVLTDALTLSGASPKTVQEATIAKNLTDATLKVAVAQKAAGASATTLSTSQAALLADPQVINKAATAPVPAITAPPASTSSAVPLWQSQAVASF